MRYIIACLVCMFVGGMSFAGDMDFKLVGVENRVAVLEAKVASLEKMLTSQSIVGSPKKNITTETIYDNDGNSKVVQVEGRERATNFKLLPGISSGGCQGGNCPAVSNTRRGFFRR